MSALAPSPPIAEFRPVWEAQETHFDLQGFSLQGSDGRKLNERIKQVAMHWYATSVQAAGSLAPDEPPYRHVPFEKVKTIRVRYLPAKPLPPRHFNLDED